MVDKEHYQIDIRLTPTTVEHPEAPLHGRLKSHH